jgi:hypothetical protein
MDDWSAALAQILQSGPLAVARARRNLSAYQNEIKPGKINVSLSDPCILILSREKASFSLSTRFRALSPPLRAHPSRGLSINVRPFPPPLSLSLSLSLGCAPRTTIHPSPTENAKQSNSRDPIGKRADRLFSDRRTSRVKTAAQLQINAHPAGQKK